MPGSAGEYQPIGPGSGGVSSGGGGSSGITVGTTTVTSGTNGQALTDNGGVVGQAPIPASANPSATAGPTAVNGSAATFMTSDSAPAIQKASASQFGIVEVDGTTVTATGGVISVPIGSSSQKGILEVDGATITAASGVISAAVGAAPASGRLTLTSGTPVLTSTVSGATTVYFTPYKGNIIPIYNGTIWVPTMFSELSQATTDTTKSPAAVGASSLYDVFVWNDSGTIRATRGPAWSSSTSRGTGAGTTQLTLQNGIFQNAVAITNGPAANRGTYVGTIGSNASSTIDFILGGSASGGIAGVLNVWNYYNRVMTFARSTDTNSSYTYTSATFRQADGSTGNQISFVSGMAEDAPSVMSTFSIICTANTGSNQITGISLDSITSQSGNRYYFNVANSNLTQTVRGTLSAIDAPVLGSHFYARFELSDGSHANTFNALGGDNISLGFLM